MAKFFISIFIGGIIGTLLAWGFLVFVPKLPDILAETFFIDDSLNSSISNAAENVAGLFKPSSDQYFIEPIDQTISTSTKVLYADLSTMNVMLFDKGQKVGEYPIKSIGREGTAWQTPVGKFEMSYKSENHFSSLGKVWMPYSMHFFGNYFIHGWPYYSDGTPVSEGYSGGCIRMNTPDAEAVYKFVDKDTQLVVTTSDKGIPAGRDFEYSIKNSAPKLNSKFIVADLESGEVVAAKDAKEKTPIGSLSKLMTGIISLETLNQYQETIYDQNIVSVSDVLYALLLSDSDEAGQLLSEHKSEKQYIKDMNTRAHSLAMNETVYTDPNGDASSTVSTLEDTIRLMQYVNSYKPFLVKLLSLEKYEKNTIRVESQKPMKAKPEYLASFSSQTKDEEVTLVGMKDGALNGKKFVIVVKDSEDAARDSEALLEWLKTSVELRNK